jgi:hypothetical protein
VENFARTADGCGLDVRQVESVRLPVNSTTQTIALYEVRWRGRRG